RVIAKALVQVVQLALGRVVNAHFIDPAVVRLGSIQHGGPGDKGSRGKDSQCFHDCGWQTKSRCESRKPERRKTIAKVKIKAREIPPKTSRANSNGTGTPKPERIGCRDLD